MLCLWRVHKALPPRWSVSSLRASAQHQIPVFPLRVFKRSTSSKAWFDNVHFASCNTTSAHQPDITECTQAYRTWSSRRWRTRITHWVDQRSIAECAAGYWCLWEEGAILQFVWKLGLSEGWNYCERILQSSLLLCLGKHCWWRRWKDLDLYDDNRTLIHSGPLARRYKTDQWADLHVALLDNYRRSAFMRLCSLLIVSDNTVLILKPETRSSGAVKYSIISRVRLFYRGWLNCITEMMS